MIMLRRTNRCTSCKYSFCTAGDRSKVASASFPLAKSGEADRPICLSGYQTSRVRSPSRAHCAHCRSLQHLHSLGLMTDSRPYCLKAKMSMKEMGRRPLSVVHHLDVLLSFAVTCSSYLWHSHPAKLESPVYYTVGYSAQYWKAIAGVNMI